MTHKPQNEGERVIPTGVNTEERHEIRTIDTVQMTADEGLLVKSLQISSIRGCHCEKAKPLLTKNAGKRLDEV